MNFRSNTILRPITICLFLFAAQAPVVLLTAQEAKSDWSRWGGPNTNMISSEADWETDWNLHSPVKQWSTNIGIGFSSVTIVKNKLYTMGRSGKKQDAVYCVNALTGKEIWRHSFDAPLEAKEHEGGPGATPTVNEGLVYTLSRDGRALCLDGENGDVVWNVPTLKLTQATSPYWGFTSTPLVIDGKVIFDVGRLLALDSKTGEVVWKTGKHKAGYGSVTEFKQGEQVRLAVLTNEALMVVELESGKTIAKTPWQTDHLTSSTTPVIVGDKFFISTGYRRGCAMFRLEGNEFKPIFENKNLSNHMNNSIWHKGNIYGVNRNSHVRRTCTLVCISAEDGQQKWFERGFGCGSVLLAGDHLIVLTDEGELLCAAASPEGFKPVGRIQAVAGKCWTVPVLINRQIFCRTAGGELVCWRLKKKNEPAAASPKKQLLKLEYRNQ